MRLQLFFRYKEYGMEQAGELLEKLREQYKELKPVEASHKDKLELELSVETDEKVREVLKFWSGLVPPGKEVFYKLFKV